MNPQEWIKQMRKQNEVKTLDYIICKLEQKIYNDPVYMRTFVLICLFVPFHGKVWTSDFISVIHH